MTPFHLEIDLRTPIILQHRLMLDSLLIGLGYEREGAASTVATDLPLLISEGIPHASQMLIGVSDMPMVRPTSHIQGFIRILSNNPVLSEMLDHQPSRSSMNPGSGPNSNIQSVYLTRAIPKVSFIGVGDIERIKNLTLTLFRLGAQSHKGYGEVANVQITEIDADPRWFGIVGYHQDQLVVLRPIPKRKMHSLPRGVWGIENDETWHYPYFPGHRDAVVEPCIVPPFATEEGFHRGAVRRLARVPRSAL